MSSPSQADPNDAAAGTAGGDASSTPGIDAATGGADASGVGVDASASATAPPATGAAQAGHGVAQGDVAAPVAGAVIATPGELGAAREARGWAIGELASKLGMVPRQVQAIERGDWNALPGQAFVRGAIRAYGKALNVDVGALLASVGTAVQAAELRPAATLEAPLPKHGALGFDNGGSGSRLTWILLAILGVIAIAMYFGRGAEWSRVLEGAPIGAGAPGRGVEALPVTPPATPAVPGGSTAAAAPGASGAQGGTASMASAAAPSGASSGPPSGTSPSGTSPSGTSPSGAAAAAPTPPPVPGATPTPAANARGGPDTARVPGVAGSMRGAATDGEAPAGAPPAPAAGTLHFRFEGESWVEVRDARGRLLLYGMQPAGSEQTVIGVRPYSLRVGNATQVRLEHDGRPVDLAAITRQGLARLKID